MAIQYVGGMSGGRAGATSTSSVNFALTGGLGEAVPKEDDLVVITVAVGTQARTPACAVSGYTALTQLNATAQTQDTSMNVSYKFMGATPDTSFTLPSTGNNQDAQSYVVQVFRGVDQTTPLDVTSQSATGTGTTRADPASITPSTAGAWIVICCGGGAAASSALTFSGLTDVLSHPDADTNDSVATMGYKSDWVSGAYNQGAATAGDATGTSSWCAYSLALRPEDLASTLTDDFEATLDTGSKWSVFTNGTGSTAATDNDALICHIGQNLASAQSNVSSQGVYNILDSSIYVKLVQPCRAAGDVSTANTYFWLENDQGDRFGFSLDTNGTLDALTQNNFSPDSTTTVTSAYFANAATYTWLRMRSDSTNLYWDTAPSSASNPPSGGDWTNRKTLARSSAPAAFSNAYVSLGVYQHSATALPNQDAKFDGLNTGATATNQSHATSGALTGPGVTLSGTSQHKAKHTTTGALAGVTVLAGTASSKTTRPSTGALTGPGAVVVGTASSKTTRPSSGALVGTGRVIVGSASSKTTRPSTGVLTGSGSVVAGTAQHKRKHATTGALASSGPSMVGAASRKVTHTSSGALGGPGSALAGVSHHVKRHTTSSVLAGPGALLAGTATRFRVHSSTAVLAAAGVLLSGTARRFRAHSTSGVLATQGVVLSGTASSKTTRSSSGALVGTGKVIAGAASSKTTRVSTGALVGTGRVIAGTASSKTTRPSTGALAGPGAVVVGTSQHKKKHTTSGVLTGPGQVLSGSSTHSGAAHNSSGALVGTGRVIVGTAAHIARHTTTGALVGTGRVISGTAARTRVHSTTGALVATGKVIAGTARRTRTHATTGSLAGVGRVITGTASRAHFHTASGVVHGPGPLLVGIAVHGGPYHQVFSTLAGPGVILSGVAGRLTYGQVGLRPAMESGSRPKNEQSESRPPRVQTTTRKNL